MPTNITITVEDQVTRKLTAMMSEQRVRGVMLPVLSSRLSKASQIIVGRAVRGRFTGRGPFPRSQARLGVVTGRLRRSIRASRPMIDADGIRIGFGSNVKYFAVHEFGSQARVNVRGHSRKLDGVRKLHRGKLTKATQRAAVKRRKKGLKTSAFVRPHQRQLKVPARAPMGTELRDPRSRQTLERETVAAVRETYNRLTRDA